MTPYINEADATAYFAERFDSLSWDDATSPNRVKALKTATRAIEHLNFQGEKAVAAQALQFPRDEDTVVPEDIKFACAEIAYALLDGIEPELEFENLDMVSQRYGNVQSTYDRSSKPAHILVGIPSVVAWRYLMPYLRDDRFVIVSRVS